MSRFVFDKVLVGKMLAQNLAKERAALAELPKKRRELIEEWRQQVEVFARNCLKKGGKIADPKKFYATVVSGGSLDMPCLENLRPPKAPVFREEAFEIKKRIDRLSDRILLVAGLPNDKKLQMDETRFAKFVAGEYLS